MSDDAAGEPRERAHEGFDADAYRADSFEGWEAAAAGWRRHERMMREFAAPVSHWLIEAVAPQPGERLLELAAGLGETAMLAAELVAPHGGVLVSDQAEAMLAGARERAQELGLDNVEFVQLNAESIDLPLASVDAAVCRWGYMLMADPAAALAETRRVLRPGGRLALAVWDEAARNPWLALPARELIERGLAPAPDAQQQQEQRAAVGPPGPFALAGRERLRTLLEQAGFLDVEVQALELLRRHASFAELWQTTLDLSRPLHDAVLSRPPEEVAAIEASLAERFVAYAAADGSLAIPARTLVARAGA
ncbi:MAG TPA: methyltransferase domain-containing protein [Solirubrobacteraceae bacterium]|nr:methyltransferase domain-containing protein [Solirubrobacteraceae bacterium]